MTNADPRDSAPIGLILTHLSSCATAQLPVGRTNHDDSR